jgi:hypothetical protein
MEDNRLKFFPDQTDEILKLEQEAREIKSKWSGREVGALKPISASEIKKDPEFIKAKEEHKVLKEKNDEWASEFKILTGQETTFKTRLVQRVIDGMTLSARNDAPEIFEYFSSLFGKDEAINTDVLADGMFQTRLNHHITDVKQWMIDKLLEKNSPELRASQTMLDFSKFDKYDIISAFNYAVDKVREQIKESEKDIKTNHNQYHAKQLEKLKSIDGLLSGDYPNIVGPETRTKLEAEKQAILQSTVNNNKKTSAESYVIDYAVDSYLKEAGQGWQAKKFYMAVMSSLFENFEAWSDMVDSRTPDVENWASNKRMAITFDMPFIRTEDFSKLMFKKVLREAVTNGYEGIILIPPELPEILTGGKSGYYYGTIFPKVINNYAKKFGAKLRQNRSIVDYKTDPLFDIIGHYLKEESKDPNYGNAQRAYDASIQAAKVWISAGDDAKLQKDLRDRVTTNKMKYGLTKEQAEQVFDYFVQVVSGMRPESQKTWGIDNGVWTGNGDITKQASRRGLILDVTPQMDVIKEGQPMWQAASRRGRKPKAEGQAETVGEVRGMDVPAPIAKKDRSIGERESGLPIPEIPKDTDKSVTVGGVGMQATAVDKRLAVEGVADYRGYKIVYDKANGGYKITDPSGKGVPVPTAYIDKITGEQVIKMNRHVVFPQEAVALVDHLLGGMPKTQDVATTPLPKPAKPQQAQVVAPAERAIPKSGETSSAPANNEMSIVKSQLEATGKSRYYIYNIEFDNKTGEYMAKDNAGQPISVTIDSPFQSGPAMVTANRTKSLDSLIAGLDKKFDKTKFARLAPRQQGAVAQPAPVAPVPAQPAPVAPVDVPPTPEPVEKPKRRIPASSVPPAVASAPTAKPTPKPKDKPQPKPNVNKPKPKVVMPEEPVAQTAEVVQSQSTQPVEVVSDKEYMDKQAKALGKGFIAMLKDPEMAKYIIDSLNVDDNLTLRGDTDTASTVDGRFSVNRKGKKYVVTQNNYDSPITGLRYDKRVIAYVNTVQQAQMLIRRLEVERNMALKAQNMPMENPLMVMASENPAFEDLARQKAIRDNALVMMLLSMRDQGIIPIYIDPNTLQPILVMMPSEEVIAQVTRPKPRIAGLLPESGGQEKLLPAVLDDAIKFDYVMDAQIKALAQNKKEVAERFINKLGYEILKFKGKFRLFNPLKATISVRDDEDAIMNDLIRDIAKKGIQQ